AHLLLRWPQSWSGEELEDSAQRFARAFLVPAEAANRELGSRRGAISAYELQTARHRYGISVQAWLDRAKELGIHSEAEASRMVQPADHGARCATIEPGDPVPAEQPKRLHRIVMRLLAEEVINERRAAELLGEPLAQFVQELPQTHGESPLLVCR